MSKTCLICMEILTTTALFYVRYLAKQIGLENIQLLKGYKNLI